MAVRDRSYAIALQCYMAADDKARLNALGSLCVQAQQFPLARRSFEAAGNGAMSAFLAQNT